MNISDVLLSWDGERWHKSLLLDLLHSVTLELFLEEGLVLFLTTLIVVLLLLVVDASTNKESSDNDSTNDGTGLALASSISTTVGREASVNILKGLLGLIISGLGISNSSLFLLSGAVTSILNNLLGIIKGGLLFLEVSNSVLQFFLQFLGLIKSLLGLLLSLLLLISGIGTGVIDDLLGLIESLLGIFDSLVLGGQVVGGDLGLSLGLLLSVGLAILGLLQVGEGSGLSVHGVLHELVLSVGEGLGGSSEVVALNIADEVEEELKLSGNSSLVSRVSSEGHLVLELSLSISDGRDHVVGLSGLGNSDQAREGLHLVLNGEGLDVLGVASGDGSSEDSEKG